ncbi:phospholipase [Plectosphaerella cucumerina]|uniref:Phospholipase n=1 Tax=Plectosphaerella cucumerina TaxID=40658 RepID=A0A8K0X5K1_9PEZI|nr:phospholipase [Plectosphaerella cucumerina]
MKPRSPTFWLALSSHESITDLVISDRPRLIAKQTSQPDVQKPSLFALIGGRAKTAALQELFGVRRRQPPGSPGPSTGIHLHVAAQSSFHERPLLIVEGGLHDGDFEAAPPSDQQDVRRRTVVRPAQQAAGSLDSEALYSRLLEPFADVFCYFCDDLGGLEAVARHLATWPNREPQPGTLVTGARPKIVIVSSTIPHGAQGENKARADLLGMVERAAGRNTSALASQIHVVALLPQGRVSAAARHRALKERIMRLSDEVRRRRVDALCLFSVTHFAAFLDVACDHFATAPDAPFDFVRGARCRSPVPKDVESHLVNFFGLANSPVELIEFAAPVVGSSLFRDAYPPDAHLFDPSDVFESLYRDPVNHACSGVALAVAGDPGMTMPRSVLVGLVKARFVECFSELHVHCDDCVWDYGHPSDDDPWTTIYGRCHLCDASLAEEAIVRRHPPTAGVVMFCLDGGGARGIVSLEILKRIHDSIGLPIPLTRFIKVFFGISSGWLATIDKKPLERIFTNYNGVGERRRSQGNRPSPFFPPKHIRGVGSFQDAGPLVDPTLSALCEVAALFPLLDEPDDVVSIGTGESRPSNAAATDDLRDPWANGAVPRLRRLFWEKMGDRKVRQVLQRQRRYHRLTVHFDGDEPMLDNARCMPEMGRKARDDPSLSEPIAHLRRCMIASLFYFELDSLPERRGGRYVGTGSILCTIRRAEPGFRELFSQMLERSVQIILDGRPVSAVGDAACFDREGNFRKAVELDTCGTLQIALREGATAPCDIGRSPFSVERLVALQGLDSVFGRRSCRKRKNSCQDAATAKRRRAM